MYTVIVNDIYSYSFENKDSALRFLSLVQNICESADIHKSEIFASCDEAMESFRKDNPTRIFICEDPSCYWQEEVKGTAPCCLDFELSCEDCLYFH